LKKARRSLSVCARDECPDFIRSDCTTWYEEVQSEMPTVVFAARSGGRDLVDVVVSLDGETVASRIDGQALELDPGEYDFAFESAGMQPLTQHSVIVRGERNRLIEVELVPVETRAAAPPSRADFGAKPRSLVAPGVFAGVGVAGIATFAVMAAAGNAAESRLERTCAPSCTREQISSVRSTYLAADVSLGIGAVSLAIGAYLFFSEPAQSAARAPAVGLQASTNGAELTYGGTF
jgi:hypothetical protein